MNRWDGLLDDWLVRQSERNGAALAVKTDTQAWSYADLADTAGRLARALAGHGVKAGDRVALVMGPSMHFIALTHAVIRLGAVAVPLNPRLTALELARLCADADPQLIVADNDGPQVDGPVLSPATLWAGADRPDILPVSRRIMAMDDPAVIVYTSGTTGVPKGVVLTCGNLWHGAISQGAHLGALPTDRWLLAMPLFHIGGLSIVFRSVVLGAGVVVHPRFDARRVSDAVDRDGITLLSLVPTMLRRLLDVRRTPFPPTLRAVLLGGGPIPAGLLQEARARNLPVAPTYGMTETASQVATGLPGAANVGPVRADPIYPTRIALLTDGTVHNQANRPGEILVSGPTVFAGYWRNADASRAAFHGRWLKTGDLGELDERGRLFVHGRRDDLIIRGGENIDPLEVEAALTEYPGIEDAAVVGVPDPEWGQRVVAFVTPGADPASLGSFLRGRLAGYKVPAEYYAVDHIPRTASGKIRRQALRERLAETALISLRNEDLS